MGIEGEPPYRPEEPDDEKAQEERRLEGIARNLGMKERMDNPAVKEYVKTIYLLEQAQQMARNNPNRPPWLSKADRINEELEPKPSINDRYLVARGMITTALEFMKHGFSEDEQFDHEYVLNHYLGYALERMGWEVKPKLYSNPEKLERVKESGDVLIPPEVIEEHHPTELPKFHPQSNQQDKN